MIKIETIYQYSTVNDPTSDADWSSCTKEQYQDLEGYDIPLRKIHRAAKPNEWDDLWYEFTKTPEYKQSIAALQFRAFFDWMKDNFNVPIKK